MGDCDDRPSYPNRLGNSAGRANTTVPLPEGSGTGLCTPLCSQAETMVSTWRELPSHTTVAL